MNILKRIIATSPLLIAGIFISCATTSEKTAEKYEEEVQVVEEEVQLEEIVEVIEEVKLTPEEEYLIAIENIALEVTETPKEVYVKKSFATPFKIKVTDNGQPLSGSAIKITYPSEKKGTELIFSSTVINSDEDGFVSYMPDVTSFAANTKVTFSLSTDFEDEAVISKITEKSVVAEYKVKSDVISKGCLLYVWEFNERNRPTNNYNNLQSELRKRGLVMCGNAPINESSDIGKPLNTLYKENYEIVEDMYGYLIVGTVKFTQPVELVEDESGYLCSLVAEISAVNMKNGTKVFEQTFENKAIGGNWTKCTTACKSELAEKIVNALVYGL